MPSRPRPLETPGHPAGSRARISRRRNAIILFQRNDASALKPEGVTANYHHRFELTVVLEKAGPVRIDRSTFLLHPGECALIFPNQFHHYMDVSSYRQLVQAGGPLPVTGKGR